MYPNQQPRSNLKRTHVPECRCGVLFDDFIKLQFFAIFITTVIIIVVKTVRWDRVEDLLAYGLLMLGLLVLPTSLVTGRYNHHHDTIFQKNHWHYHY